MCVILINFPRWVQNCNPWMNRSALLAYRRWKARKGADLRLGGPRRSCSLDAPTHHPDAEALRSEYPACGRTQGTFGRPEGCYASYGAPVRYVSSLVLSRFLIYAKRESIWFENRLNSGERCTRLFGEIINLHMKGFMMFVQDNDIIDIK